MNRTFQILILAVMLMAGLLSCTDNGRSANTTANPVVIGKAEALMTAIKNQDIELAIKQYPDSFFSRQDPEIWKQKLISYGADRGPMLSFKMVKSQADTRFSGKFYILEYMAIHDGNKRANHLITLLLPVEGGDIKIIGHKITPWLDE